MAFLGMAASTVLSRVAPQTFPAQATGGVVALPGLGWYVVTLVYSFVFAVMGGHTCARLAKRAALGHASVLAALIGALGLSVALDPASPLPAWRTAGYLIANVAGVLLGGAIHSLARTPADPRT